jgi:hypothetical protein
MVRFFSKSSKIAPEPPPAAAPTVLDMYIFQNTDPIWKEFSIYVPADEENEYPIDYTNPGPLAYELAKLCSHEKAFDLNAQKIMYFSEVTNYLFVLKKDKETIGFLLLDSYKESSDAKIWLVCIGSKFKGKQLSKILIDQAKRIAKEQGKTEIHLEALNREVGTKVYMAQGFTFNSPRGENMTAQLGGCRQKTRRQRRRHSTGTRRRSRRVLAF